MDVLYQETNNLVHDVQFTVGRLEQARNESDAQPLFQAVHQQLQTLQANCQRLDHLASKEPIDRKRAAKHRAEQMRFELNALSSSVHNIQARLTNKWRALAEREELLTQRIRPVETGIHIDESEIMVHDHMKHSHRAIDDMIAQGSAILTNMKEQGLNLKAVRTKILDIGQTLGLSGTTLRMIEKRLEEDWWIFIVGCVFVLIFMYCFYRYWKG
uniref:Golgi SNAP receptor complex member 2 n=1 Tax=Panagrolaimus sp. JU765 TaxID=591449 RepID=A0AC34PX56_9BILA